MTGVHFNERKELHELKRLLSEYGILEIGQIYAYFHYKSEDIIRGIMGYMTRNGLIAADLGARRAAVNGRQLKEEPDRKLIASFWAMLQYIETIQYHTRAQFPAQIYFFADGAEYEVIYVALGEENMINAIFAREPEGDTRYLVVVEEPRQLETLDIPRVEWFCTVGEDGAIRKYIQED